jgi:hypothetical protein
MTLAQVANCERQKTTSSSESLSAPLERQAWCIGGEMAAALVSFGFAALSLAANANEYGGLPSYGADELP